MTPQRSYPPAPPFPHQATHNIAQAYASAGPDEPETVTLIRDGVHHLEVAADKYVGGYDPTGVARGAVVALHGEHGAGKTHAIWYVMQHLQGRLPSFADVPKSGSLCQLYAKVDGPDPLQLYRALVTQIGPAQMRELSRAFQAVVAAEQGVGGDGDPLVRTAVRRHLRESPGVVDRLFESSRLEPGAVREGGAQEIERIGEAWRDFERAVTGLRMAKLAALAHRWLCGEQLRTDDLDRLGVRSPITTPDMVLLGLRVMARLFRRAEIPLAIYVDQVEGLVLSGDGATPGAEDEGEAVVEQSPNMGLLRSLLEVLPQEGALVVVAGNLEAWQAYPRDVKQRFADGPLLLPALTESEATELIVAYLAPFKPPRVSKTEVLYPFKPDAVPELLRFGGGNVRRFLQHCSLAFNEAFPGRVEIDAAIVRKALERVPAAALDRASVLAQARHLLTGRGLSVTENVPLGGVPVDLVVTAPDGRPVAVVKLNEAIFRAQEAQDVRDSLDLVRRAKAEGDPLHVVLVVLGYVSPDMTRILEEVADDTVVSSAEGFEAAFLAALARIPVSVPARGSGSGDGEAIGERIEELQKALIDVLEKRRGDEERVQAQLDALLRRQEEERAQSGRDEARKTWILERSRLEREIREERASRARAEIEELERIRNATEAGRAARTRRSAAAAGVAGALVLVLLIGLAVGHGVVELAVPAICAVGAVVAGALAWRDFEAARHLCPPELRDLANHVASEDELLQLVSRTPTVGREHLRSPYPAVRYAAAVSASGGDARAAEALALALPRERSAVVRRALARSLGTAEQLERDFYEKHELVGVPEVAYIADVTKGDVGMETSQGFAAVKALREHDDRTFLRIALQLQLDDVTVMKLAEGHRRGLERLGTTQLRDHIPERARRAAIEFLSPFEGAGLGTFDRLEVVREIDAWYLFFREMQWYSELGWAEWRA